MGLRDSVLVGMNVGDGYKKKHQFASFLVACISLGTFADISDDDLGLEWLKRIKTRDPLEGCVLFSITYIKSVYECWLIKQNDQALPHYNGPISQ